MTQVTDHFGPFQINEIFCQLPAAWLLSDAEGKLQEWNDKAARLLDGALQPGDSLYGLITNELERKRVRRKARETARDTQMHPRLRVTLRCAGGAERMFSLGLYALSKPGQHMALLWHLEPAAEADTEQLPHEQLAALLVQEVLHTVESDPGKVGLLTRILGCRPDELDRQPRLEAILRANERLFVEWLDTAATTQQVRAAAEKVAILHDRAGVPPSFLFEAMANVWVLASKLHAPACFFTNSHLFVRAVLAGHERLLEAKTRLMQDKERELAEQQAYWREVFDTLTEGVNIATLDGAILETNAAFAELVGYSKEELYRTGWLELTAPEDREEDSKHLPDILAGKVVRFEKTYIHKDGHHIPILISYRLLKKRPDWDKDRLIVTCVDLTQARAREAELARARQFAEQVIEAAPVALAICDKDGTFELGNAAYCQLIGTTPEAIRSGAFTPNRDITGEDGARRRAAITQVYQTGETLQTEAVFTDRANHRLELRVATRRITGIDGQFRVLTAIADLTDLKRKEHELAEQQAYWRHFIDIAPVGVVEYDTSGRYYEANPAFCQMLDMSHDEVCSPSFDWRPYFTETLDQAQAMNAQAMRTSQPVRGEIIIHDRHGRKHVVDAVCMQLEKQGRFACYHMDITELKEKEHALEDAARYQQALFDAATEGHTVFGTRGEQFDVNTAFADMLGYSRQELTDAAFNWESITAPEFVAEDHRQILKALQGEVVRYEKAFIRKDGLRIPAMISYRKLPRLSNWPQERLFSTISDISELKAQEARLQTILHAQQQAIAAIGQRLSSLAQGDLASDAPQGLQGELARLGEDLGTLIASLRDATGRIQRAVSDIRGGLHNLIQGNHNLDERTAQQAASTEEISTAIEELSSSVAHSAEHARITAQRTGEVKAHAEQGAKLIYAAEEKMASITKASEAIAEIITVVDEIAFSTNILALNAAVEAARAGEHGRGFAVVAAEVRRLARSSATNAKDIKKLIAQSTSLITEGSTLSAQGTEAFIAILQGIREVSERIAEIAEATSSQGKASTQLTAAITEVSRTTQANSALVEENSAACGSLAEQAEQLEELAGMFRVG